MWGASPTIWVSQKLPFMWWVRVRIVCVSRVLHYESAFEDCQRITLRYKGTKESGAGRARIINSENWKFDQVISIDNRWSQTNIVWRNKPNQSKVQRSSRPTCHQRRSPNHRAHYLDRISPLTFETITNETSKDEPYSGSKLRFDIKSIGESSLADYFMRRVINECDPSL